MKGKADLMLEDFRERIRLTRIALGLKQEEFGRLGGVSLSAQHAYEKGVRFPDMHYMALLESNNVDTLHLMFGNRVSVLGSEKKLIQDFRKMDLKNKRLIMELISSLKGSDNENE